MTTPLTPEERLFQAIGQVDDILLERLDKQLHAVAPVPSDTLYTKRTSITKRRRRQLGIATGLIALVVACVLIFTNSWQQTSSVIYTASESVVNSYQPSNQKRPADVAPTAPPTSPVAPAMQMPSNGKVLYSSDIQQALQAYQDQQVQFLVAVDLFQDGASVPSDSQQVQDELKRLQAQGYSIGYANHWTYDATNKQTWQPFIAAYLTAAELEQFKASPNYGYYFQFATNGDGSPVSAEQGIYSDGNDLDRK